MVKLLKTILTITMILSSFQSLKGQIIRSLPYNHAVAKALKEGGESHLKSARATSFNFENEFFEDFSDYHQSVFPRNDKWADRYAFINSTYADSMISLGVATLDAYDEFGYPYYSDTNKLTAADTLTSLPFIFPENMSGRYFFSFFYQPGGKGDLPESTDTLLLDFYYQKDHIWVNMMKIIDNTKPNNFTQMVLEVPESFLTDSFRFRFRNYVSLPSYPQGQDLGQFGNADMWHIDYIQLRQAANAAEMENLDDIMITEPLLPTLREYTSVPWLHYSLALSSAGNERTTTTLAFRTYFPDMPENILSVDRFYDAFDQVDPIPISSRSYYATDFPPFDYFSREDNFKPGLLADASKKIGKLYIRAYIEGSTETVNSNRFVNDTVKRFETYYDHYAYDDGIAELGIGIGGETQDNAKMALRFRSFRKSENPDTLKAVLIYFCKSANGASANATYKISIRKNSGNVPDSEVLYESAELSPDYDAGLNDFTRIEIDPLVISDTFFVVIEQLNGFLNIGYDINNNTTDKLYFYVNQQWNLSYSMQKGALMVRPSFGSGSLLPLEAVRKEDFKMTVFPNPVTDKLNFSLGEDLAGPYSIKIYDMLGTICLNEITYNSHIDVGYLPDGMYFIMINSASFREPVTAKFLKH